jgi:hypothetical protein
VKHNVLKCSGCGERIRDTHPHIGLEDYDSGQERYYHAACQQQAAAVVAQSAGEGQVWLMHLYHVCPDTAPGYDCSKGCFAA